MKDTKNRWTTKASSSPDGLSRADSSIAQAANLNKMLIQSIQEGANYENR